MCGGVGALGGTWGEWHLMWGHVWGCGGTWGEWHLRWGHVWGCGGTWGVWHLRWGHVWGCGGTCGVLSDQCCHFECVFVSVRFFVDNSVNVGTFVGVWQAR